MDGRGRAIYMRVDWDKVNRGAVDPPKGGPVYTFDAHGAAQFQCPACHVRTPVWGAGTALVGHWGWINNPRLGKRTANGAVDTRERIRIPFVRKREVCAPCAAEWGMQRATHERDELVMLDDGYYE